MLLEHDGKSSSNWDYKYVEVQNNDEELGKSESKRNYIQEYITTAISGFGMLICGIHFTWIGPILPQLLSGNFKIQITMEQSVWVIGLVQVGAIPGCIIASIVANVYGRKKAILFATIPFIISAIITTFAETVLHYYIARFIGGFGVGIAYSVIPMYISEISSAEIRGILGTSIHLSLSVGAFICFVLGAYLPIVTYSAVCAIFPIIMLCFTFYLPETPYFRVVKHDYEEAENILKFLRKKIYVRDELKRLIEGYKAETAEKKQSWLDLFRDNTNRKSVIIITALLMAQQWTGGIAIFSYSQVIFVDGHSSISAETCGIFLSFMNFAVVFLCGALVDRLGRRILLMISGSITILPLVILSGYFYLQDHTNFVYIENLRLIPLIAIVFFKFSIGIGVSSLPYLILGELFPTSVKAHAASVISISGSVVGVAGNKMYQVFLQEFGYSATFVIFIMWMILALIFVYFMVPETKGLTLEEIQVKLRKSNKKQNQVVLGKSLTTSCGQ
ncbi:facilitated trehalose transporter Tret1-2 homolog [Chrysoperla carnea]|uniref:facilitated trehalose transporter Tret1-2 homolog n=1 Tax=Chrysoperla carnea TaxID=189513 RepID=UPI001D064F65|nr:facilitated trehalose transporter Tret1-2 homolog [Chrysoperla carnea]